MNAEATSSVIDDDAVSLRSIATTLPSYGEHHCDGRPSSPTPSYRTATPAIAYDARVRATTKTSGFEECDPVVFALSFAFRENTSRKWRSYIAQASQKPSSDDRKLRKLLDKHSSDGLEALFSSAVKALRAPLFSAHTLFVAALHSMELGTDNTQNILAAMIAASCLDPTALVGKKLGPINCVVRKLRPFEIEWISLPTRPTGPDSDLGASSIHPTIVRSALGHTPFVDYITDFGHDSPKWRLSQATLMLIKGGMDPNLTDFSGKTPLHHVVAYRAAKFNEMSCVKTLLSVGADINVQDDKGRTPLHYVSNRQLARLLVDHGARLDTQDQDGITPLRYAIRSFYPGSRGVGIFVLGDLWYPQDDARTVCLKPTTSYGREGDRQECVQRLLDDSPGTRDLLSDASLLAVGEREHTLKDYYSAGFMFEGDYVTVVNSHKASSMAYTSLQNGDVLRLVGLFDNNIATAVRVDRHEQWSLDDALRDRKQAMVIHISDLKAIPVSWRSGQWTGTN